MITTVYPLSSHGGAIVIPDGMAMDFLNNDVKRIICIFQNGKKLHGMINKGEQVYFLMVGKQTAREYGVIPGDEIDVQFIEDTTRYQMAVSEEFLEVLTTDPEGEDLFHQLTPGKQRSVLHSINKIKSSNLRIEKALRLMENLRRGQSDLKLLLK